LQDDEDEEEQEEEPAKLTENGTAASQGEGPKDTVQAEPATLTEGMGATLLRSLEFWLVVGPV
jgi:hypothetical protein